jgi:endonuclease/exonuclease/phosphatase (EEP) superfamily protein YafD
VGSQLRQGMLTLDVSGLCPAARVGGDVSATNEGTKGMMKRIFFFLLLLAAASLVLLLLATLFNYWFALADSLSHFRVHFCLTIILAAVCFAALRAWRMFGALVLFFAIGAGSIYPAWPMLSPHAQLSHPLKLIQFNTLFNNPTPDRSLAWLKSEAPDFLMMQEVSKQNMVIFDGMAEMMPYGIVCRFATVGGVAVRSKFPLTGQYCAEGQGMTWARAAVSGKEVTFASVHLHWPYPFKQWRQLDGLKADFKAMPRPVILTGDFNAAAWSEAAARVAAATDTRVVSGLRMTLRMGPRPIGPVAFLPIDQVLMPDDVVVGEIGVGPAVGSDHLPVVVVFELR